MKKLSRLIKSLRFYKRSKFVISFPTTKHGGIWVGPLLTSSKDIAQNAQATFDWVSSAVKHIWGICASFFFQKWTRLLYERSESSSNTIWSLATKNFGQMPRYVASLDGQMPHPLELQRGSNPPPSRHVTHEINEYKQNRLPLETNSVKF